VVIELVVRSVWRMVFALSRAVCMKFTPSVVRSTTKPASSFARSFHASSTMAVDVMSAERDAGPKGGVNPVVRNWATVGPVSFSVRTASAECAGSSS
jgi:hypothetical protein